MAWLSAGGSTCGSAPAPGFRPPGRRGPRPGPGGFTLLELIVAVTLLASFVLPLLYVIASARVRAYRYTQARQVRALAQQKLHDRIHYYEEEDSGTFESEGHPSWTWEIDPPQIRSQSEQVLLEYTVRVHVPIQLEEGSGEEGEGSTYEYGLWTFPDERWYEEQQYLYESGQYSPLYGDPNLGY